MKSTRGVMLLLAALVLSSPVLAQRHDDKPHGMTKPPQGATISDPKVHPGGRHDEASHKQAITAQKKKAKGDVKDASKSKAADAAAPVAPSK